MPKLSIRNILIAINVVFLFLFVVFSVFSFLSISKVSENYDGLIKGFYQYKTLSDTASVLKEIKISPSADVNALSLEAESHFNEFLKHAPVKTESGVKMTQDLKNALAKEINSLKQGGAQVADASEFDDLANDFNGLIMKYDVNGGADFIVEFSRKNNFYMILLSFLFVGLIFASHIIVRKLVTNRISEVNHLSRMIADGDLTGDIAVGRKDEIGGLFLNIREMQQFLKDIISSVKNDVRLIDDSSSAIAEGNLDLSSRTQQQGQLPSGNRRQHGGDQNHGGEQLPERAFGKPAGPARQNYGS